MNAKPENFCAEVKDSLIGAGLFSPEINGKGNTWRISPDPFYLSPDEVHFFEQLGPHLLKFYSSLNQIYLDSVKGKAPTWVAEYLDMGKPTNLIEYSRMRRFKDQLPGIIRPDVIATKDGFAVTELDSVPGGFGLTARLMKLYSDRGCRIVGMDEGGIPDLFYKMAESVAGKSNCSVAILVSDEAVDYLSEMVYLGEVFREKGLPVYVAHPKDIIFTEENLYLNRDGKKVSIDVIYRFFELFDLKNVPKSELLAFSNKKGKVRTTPPYKPFLEEKLSFALFHHPNLTDWWEKALGIETFSILSHLIPNTWVLDNREMPPYGVIPDLLIRGGHVREWSELKDLTQKERELVIKISGFSPKSWGSRGVTVGHDVSGEVWNKTLEESLDNFSSQPSVLQTFHKGKRIKTSYFDLETKTIREMYSRVRLTPYYFVVEGKTHLGGILATSCPDDKKKIHGMVDATMVPCAACS